MAYLLAGNYETAADSAQPSGFSLCPGRILAASYSLPLLVISVMLMKPVASGKNSKRSIQNTPSVNISHRQPFKRKRTSNGLPRVWRKPDYRTNDWGCIALLGDRKNLRSWPSSMLAVAQQFGSNRNNSGHAGRTLETALWARIGYQFYPLIITYEAPGVAKLRFSRSPSIRRRSEAGQGPAPRGHGSCPAMQRTGHPIFPPPVRGLVCLKLWGRREHA